VQEETIVELLWSYHAASSVAFFISFLSNPGSKDPSNILFNYKISFLWHSVSLQICLSLYTCNYNSKFHFCDIQFHYRFVSPCTLVIIILNFIFVTFSFITDLSPLVHLYKNVITILTFIFVTFSFITDLSPLVHL
jgi:hypothetical protein